MVIEQTEFDDSHIFVPIGGRLLRIVIRGQDGRIETHYLKDYPKVKAEDLHGLHPLTLRLREEMQDDYYW